MGVWIIFVLVCLKFFVDMLIIFIELFIVDVSRVLEEIEDFKGEERMCEVLFIMWFKLLL